MILIHSWGKINKFKITSKWLKNRVPEDIPTNDELSKIIFSSKPLQNYQQDLIKTGVSDTLWCGFQPSLNLNKELL